MTNNPYIPIPLSYYFPPILACGPQQKNRVCLVKEKTAFLSNDLGDLEQFDNYTKFEDTILKLKSDLNVKPELIAYDQHPEYLSTKYALNQNGAELIGIQHHHAHIVSCMVEHKLDEKVIGIAFDGTGYGEDGCLWGGEFFIADLSGYIRKAHLVYLPMPGGAMAIREPYRMAISYLYSTFGDELFDLKIQFIKDIPKVQLERIIQLLKKGLNVPLTSSIGRFFDAVSSLLRIRDRIEFEGQAAIELEEKIKIVNNDPNYTYLWKIDLNHDPWIIDLRPTVRGIVSDLLEGKDIFQIALIFHNTIAHFVQDIALKIMGRERIKKVVLSGGVFYNSYLLSKIDDILTGQGFSVYVGNKILRGDGGIALGQAVIAGTRKIRS
ncbi:MAG: hypothetical protein V1872_10955 [bacterium]